MLSGLFGVRHFRPYGVHAGTPVPGQERGSVVWRNRLHGDTQRFISRTHACAAGASGQNDRLHLGSARFGRARGAVGARWSTHRVVGVAAAHRSHPLHTGAACCSRRAAHCPHVSSPIENMVESGVCVAALVFRFVET